MDLTGETLVKQAMEAVRERIIAKTIPSGAKLPSIREFAKSMNVSKSTVVNAYDRLASEGVIESRRGSGFYVAGRQTPLSIHTAEPNVDREIDPLWVSRQSLDSHDNFLKPGCGWLPSSWMPEDSLRRALRVISRGNGSVMTQYGTSLGFPPMRDRVSRQLRHHGVEVGSDQIVLVESGAQALDLICRFLVAPGETVAVDDPCYFNFNALLRVHRVNIVSVKYNENGPDIEEFEQAVSQYRPKLYITNSGLHNPTGASLSPVIAFKILKLAEKYDFSIIEDDAFSEFEHHSTPRLAAFDELNRIVQSEVSRKPYLHHCGVDM